MMTYVLRKAPGAAIPVIRRIWQVRLRHRFRLARLAAGGGSGYWREGDRKRACPVSSGSHWCYQAAKRSGLIKPERTLLSKKAG
jgi:N-methylhydantoinase A/oxoprolinase/acetone carboxylase beta subunit